MATEISFPYVLAYRDDDLTGAPAPAIRLEISSAIDVSAAIDITAHLDSGAASTLFQGDLAPLIGLKLLDGTDKTFAGAAKNTVSAKVHRVRLAHSQLGEHEMDIAFAMDSITRNLLGRDFFRLFKVCFREYQQELYIDVE